MDNKLLKKISSYLKKKKGLAAAYVFGSQAKGKTTKNSDVDIAILYEKNGPDVLSLIEEKQNLADHLGMETDLVSLNTANPILQFQVLKHGTLLFNKNQKKTSSFIVKTINAYDDLKRMRKPIEANMMKGKIYGG
ncbi:MAG: hypothetical protein A3G32_09670 [Deltaproteobacteria bacterium RIFCSPLOWO2_12_FULL_40_28]|nr:MAG: hypothetical protein A3C45_04765 [Deltaproteobacteria bacterium RIFCSPHIGHO2_02_FULL_40_28]OGQ20225.1 MAG: hypothetical protein A3E27_06045 [Deltaproteobacteria bacterium RIFCSPHIGHO2_12_FULL_40_32]OGQ40344.1 MAG: hypothetical protein A3I69_08925 [Deltaproteobacteria bacterium RIFCSPLOWO2_02_FULL_40_36]OGQ54798.1 MAG: hypothetical protein A3G32_09670 [Deltaproteobacteria bacterium RIFCSPLOWO2_12_FULL_40_28]